MKQFIVLLISIVFMQNLFAQDTVIDKMNQGNRNKTTDTVKVGGTNDNMNVYDHPTSDSIRQSDSQSNLRGSDTTATIPADEAKTGGTQRIVSRGLVVAFLVIIIAIVARRRRNRKIE